MTTDIEHVDPELAREERAMRLLERQVTRVQNSLLVPERLRGKTSDLFLLGMKGREHGIELVSAWDNLYVINDRVAMSAQLMVALAYRAGHQVWITQSTNERATAKVRRAGEQDATEITWTIEDAKTANLTNKTNWKQFPAAMLRARALSNAVRAACPEVLMGFREPSVPLEFDEAGVQFDADPPDGVDGDTGEVADQFAADNEAIDGEVLDDVSPEQREDTPDAHTYDDHVPSGRVEDPQSPNPSGEAEHADAPIDMDPELTEDEKKNPYAAPTHILAHQLGLPPEALDAILQEQTGDVTAKGVTRDNYQTICLAMRAEANRLAEKAAAA